MVHVMNIGPILCSICFIGTIQRQNEYIFCEEKRYWVAVLAGGVSSVLIILLLLYFAASYYRRIDNYQPGFSIEISLSDLRSNRKTLMEIPSKAHVF